MKFIKQSSRPQPKISLILLDWSVRESFHLIDYLSRQNVDRDLFEIIIVEYYSRVSDVIRPFEGQVDTWLVLEMPENCYYHKHLMYNVGIVAAKGDICVICDSDAMVREGFISTIITEFDNNLDIVLHIDQFRNTRRDLYPFCYPSFEEVISKGCINNVGGQTKGLIGDVDPIHSRNYGACMCARRKDLIAIGGSDEHDTYLGHICGPYDMTFRLVNFGCREVWHQTEFMYHTWHPGQAGEDNYLGPHDGRHVSTTALDALISGQIMPLVENKTIRNLRIADGGDHVLESFQISLRHLIAWRKDNINRGQKWVNGSTALGVWNWFVVEKTTDGFVAFPKLVKHPAFVQCRGELEIYASTETQLHERLVNSLPLSMRVIFPVITLIMYLSQAISLTYLYLQRRFLRLMKAFQA
jgi:hypothetical protein